MINCTVIITLIVFLVIQGSFIKCKESPARPDTVTHIYTWTLQSETGWMSQQQGSSAVEVAQRHISGDSGV